MVKAEHLNPGGSVKDRPALSMILDGERSGKLRPGMTIIDATSGNTGIAYAMIGAARGYPVTVCLPKNASAQRKQIPEPLTASRSLKRIRCFQQMAHSEWRVNFTLQTLTSISIRISTINDANWLGPLRDHCKRDLGAVGRESHTLPEWNRNLRNFCWGCAAIARIEPNASRDFGSTRFSTSRA